MPTHLLRIGLITISNTFYTLRGFSLRKGTLYLMSYYFRSLSFLY